MVFKSNAKQHLWLRSKIHSISIVSQKIVDEDRIKVVQIGQSREEEIEKIYVVIHERELYTSNPGMCMLERVHGTV